VIKRLLIAAIMLLAVLAQGQQPTTVPPTSQAEFRAANTKFISAAQTLFSAQRDYDLASSQRDAVVFKIMARVGVSPEKFDATIDKDGNLMFVPKPVPSPTPK